MLAKNQCFEMTCDAFGQDAQGVCRHEGMAVFVPGLLPGERALVRIVKPEKRYAFGRVEKLLDKKVISVSAKEHLGINELEETIKTMFFHGKLEFNDEVYITNVRHKAALKNACDSLAMVRKSIADGMPEDFYSIDLMSAYEELGKIIGEAVDDDLVNEIFSKFCMGK